MTKDQFSFEEWFGVLQCEVLDQAGVDFKDMNAVRVDYDSGRIVYDVIDEIVAEYQ